MVFCFYYVMNREKKVVIQNKSNFSSGVALRYNNNINKSCPYNYGKREGMHFLKFKLALINHTLFIFLY